MRLERVPAGTGADDVGFRCPCRQSLQKIPQQVSLTPGLQDLCDASWPGLPAQPSVSSTARLGFVRDGSIKTI